MNGCYLGRLRIQCMYTAVHALSSGHIKASSPQLVTKRGANSSGRLLFNRAERPGGATILWPCYAQSMALFSEGYLYCRYFLGAHAFRKLTKQGARPGASKYLPLAGARDY